MMRMALRRHVLTMTKMTYLDLWEKAILLKVKCAIDCIGGGGFG